MNLQVATAPNGIFADQRDEVAKLLLTRFKEKQYDAGLTEALQFIDQTLQKKRSSAPQEVKTPVAKFSGIEQKAVSKDQSATEPVKTANKMAAPSVEAVSDRVGFDVMWVVWGFAILGALWLVIGILRALFGAGKLPPPPPPKASFSPMPSSPPAPTSGPAPAYGSSPYPQKQYPQQSPYQSQQPYQAPPQAPLPQSRGGVLPSLLGGLFGGVAGGWMYDRFRGGASVSYSTGSQPPLPPVTQTPAPQPPFGYKPPPAEASSGYSSSGGDFGAPVPDQSRYVSSGGDFGQPTPVQSDYATSGGEFGQSEPAPHDDASTGGDFAQPSPEQPDTTSVGGDFDASSQEVVSAGGDFGAPEIPVADQASSGGDFAPPPEPPANDWAAPEAGGGDFGGNASSEG